MSLALTLVLAAVCQDHQPRLWTAQSGDQLEAAFVVYNSGKVTLRREDESVITVPVSGLIEKDQEHVRQLATFRAGKLPNHASSKLDELLVDSAKGDHTRELVSDANRVERPGLRVISVEKFIPSELQSMTLRHGRERIDVTNNWGYSTKLDRTTREIQCDDPDNGVFVRIDEPLELFDTILAKGTFLQRQRGMWVVYPVDEANELILQQIDEKARNANQTRSMQRQAIIAAGILGTQASSALKARVKKMSTDVLWKAHESVIKDSLLLMDGKPLEKKEPWKR